MQSNTPTTPILLLTPEQAATALGISERKLRAMTASGEIHCVRADTGVLYAFMKVKRFVHKKEKGGEAK